MNKKEWTLTEISKLLQQPQHRLIYLCEKNIIIPDGMDADGRGSSRRFSARNLFEFSIVLTLGEFYIPSSISGKILLALRSFERALKNSFYNLELPYSLRIKEAPTIRIFLTKGACLHFAIGEGIESKLIGGVDLLNNHNNVNWPTVTELSEQANDSSKASNMRPAGSELGFFEFNLTQIAKNLPIEQHENHLKLVSSN